MSLFNTKDGEEFVGIQSDIQKARKGTPEYEEWLRKYREKRGKSADSSSKSEAAKQILSKQPDSAGSREAEQGTSDRSKESDEQRVKRAKDSFMEKNGFKGTGVKFSRDDNTRYGQQLVHDRIAEAPQFKYSADVLNPKLLPLDRGHKEEFEEFKKVLPFAEANSSESLRKEFDLPAEFNPKIGYDSKKNEFFLLAEANSKFKEKYGLPSGGSSVIIVPAVASGDKISKDSSQKYDWGELVEKKFGDRIRTAAKNKAAQE